MRNMMVGNHELQGDQSGDAGEGMHDQWFRSGHRPATARKGTAARLVWAASLRGTGAKGPGHGAEDISRAEKNRNQQGQENPRRGAAAEIRIAGENDNPGTSEAQDNSENADQVWRAHAEN